MNPRCGAARNRRRIPSRLSELGGISGINYSCCSLYKPANQPYLDCPLVVGGGADTEDHDSFLFSCCFLKNCSKIHTRHKIYQFNLFQVSRAGALCSFMLLPGHPLRISRVFPSSQAETVPINHSPTILSPAPAPETIILLPVSTALSWVFPEPCFPTLRWPLSSYTDLGHYLNLHPISFT